jgi:hypothetical protein
LRESESTVRHDLSARFARGDNKVHQLAGSAVMEGDTELIDELEALERSLNDLAHVFGGLDDAKMLSHTAMELVVSVDLSQLAEAA